MRNSRKESRDLDTIQAWPEPGHLGFGKLGFPGTESHRHPEVSLICRFFSHSSLVDGETWTGINKMHYGASLDAGKSLEKPTGKKGPWTCLVFPGVEDGWGLQCVVTQFALLGSWAKSLPQSFL